MRNTSVLCSALEETAAAINNWEALQVAVSDAERLQVGAGLDAHTDFLPSSIDQRCEEGGSSDVVAKLLGCVRVQPSEGRRRVGIKKTKKRTEVVKGPRRADRGCTGDRPASRTAGQTWRAPRRKNTKRNYYGA